uniref:CCHC-type domain-containing protein n=1 Tax=Cannabis sativa TaxID=3483 RepID=A0A803PK85_CANSA
MMKICWVRIIPNSLLLKRWSIDAKTIDEDTELNPCEYARYGALNSDANMMNYYASQSTTHYNIAKEEIARLTTMFKEGFEIGESSCSAPAPRSYRDNPNIIQDPTRVRTKGTGNAQRRDGEPTNGTGSRQRQCGLCCEMGHNSRTCPNRGTTPAWGRGRATTRHTLEQNTNSGNENVQGDTNMPYSTQGSFQSSYY